MNDKWVAEGAETAVLVVMAVVQVACAAAKPPAAALSLAVPCGCCPSLPAGAPGNANPGLVSASVDLATDLQFSLRKFELQVQGRWTIGQVRAPWGWQ